MQNDMNNQDILSSLGFSKGIRYGLKRKWQWIENLSLATVVGKWWLRRNNPKRSKSADFDKYWPTVTPLVHFASFTSPWSVRLPQESWISVDRLSVFPLSIVTKNWPCTTPCLYKAHPPMARFPGSNRTNIGHLHHFHDCPISTQGGPGYV